MGFVMTAIALKNLEWYTSMLEPLDNEMKISIINRLSHSMLEKNSDTISDFSDFSGAWENDDLSPEEEADMIREARTSGVSHKVMDW